MPDPLPNGKSWRLKLRKRFCRCLSEPTTPRGRYRRLSQGGNKVSFNDAANVQGRLGLRVGTTTQLWRGITAEPFIGSLWGNLSNDNQATLVRRALPSSSRITSKMCGERFLEGVNFFNPTASTSVFAKVDVTFGQGIDGVGGKAGMRVCW